LSAAQGDKEKSSYVTGTYLDETYLNQKKPPEFVVGIVKPNQFESHKKILTVQIEFNFISENVCQFTFLVTR